MNLFVELEHVLRKPCKCGSVSGKITTRNGQDCVFCLTCGTYQYNAPKVETGREARSVATVHEGIKPKMRTRIVLRASGHCELCGKAETSDSGLHVGHIISVKDGLQHGLTEYELNSDENLCAMCSECNLGLGAETLPIRLMTVMLKKRTEHRSEL